VLETVRYVSHDEPSVRIRQEVVYTVPFRNRTIVLQRVDVVVVGASTQFRFQKARSNEHQARRNNQLTGLCGNEQTALIRPSSDLNDSSLKRGFIQVSSAARIAVRAARNQRMRSRTQDNTVTVGRATSKCVVKDSSSLNLLGVRHGTSQSLGVTS
jgi:hypothetical protein